MWIGKGFVWRYVNVFNLMEILHEQRTSYDAVFQT